MRKMGIAIALITLTGITSHADARKSSPQNTYRVVKITTEPIHSPYARRVASRLWLGAGRKPAKWCGWYMRRILHYGNSSYNMARQWASYGHAARGPRIGAVIVWRHHVGIIVGRSRGRWIIHQGNHRNRVATVATSQRRVRQAIAFRISPKSVQVASAYK